MGDVEGKEEAMTILGKHTLDETRHLIRTVEFRIQETDKVYANISDGWKSSNTAAWTELQGDWAAFRKRWVATRDEVLRRLLVITIGNPLVSESVLPSEPEYKLIKCAINVGCEDTYTKGDLTDCILRIEKAAGAPIDETNKPIPAGWDPDLKAYKEVDGAVKKGEAAAAAAAASGKKLVASNLPLVIGGGIALVGVAVVGTIVATKVYL